MPSTEPVPRSLAPNVLERVWSQLRSRSGTMADGALLAAVAWVHLLFAKPFMWGPIGFDEHFFLYEGFCLGKGAVPYRDFQEFKPPVIFVLNMLALKMFGLQGMHFRMFFLLLSLVTFLVVAVALRSRRVPRLVILAAEALMLNNFLDGNFLAYPGPGATMDFSETAGLWFFLLGVSVLLLRPDASRPERFRRWQQRIGGVLLALSPLSKEPFAVPTLLAWGTLLMLRGVEAPPGTAPSARREFVRDTVAAALSLAGIWLFYMLVTRSFGAYLTNLRQTMVYAAEHNVTYGVFPKLGFWDSLAESWKRIHGSYVNGDRLWVFMPYFLAALVLWPRRPVAMAAGVVATFLGGSYAVTIGHGFFGHYFIVVMTGCFFAALMGCAAMGERYDELPAVWRRWVIPILALLAFFALKPRFDSDDPNWATHARPPVSDRLVKLVQAHTAPSDTIWSVGMPMINVAADRAPGSRIPYMHDSLLHLYKGGTAAEKFAPYRQELDRKMPKLVILDEGRQGREQHMDVLVMPFLRDHGYHLLPGAEVPVYERPY